MENWRQVWRDGFAPVLPTVGLDALRKALKRDDARLLQGATTAPINVADNRRKPPEGCDALGYCGWRGENLRSVGEVEDYFGSVCAEADERLGEPAGCRHFLNWYDDAPRPEMRRDLLAEVERTLEARFQTAARRAAVYRAA